ncbi:MAG TPA: Na+/H+ antiporter NhaA [Marmoricola sp.]|nr:Na+/H+ antiporter NhaA [Marmoricola sp.]
MRSSDHDSPQQEQPTASGEQRFLRDLFTSEAIGGGLALAAALVAVVWANLDLDAYRHFQHLKLGPLSLEHWAADGGLTLFFFVAGLELKREFVWGSLRDPRTAAIPVVAACCGVAVPALVFVLLDLGGGSMRGWAIPAPTDIAFALAVLAVIGRRAPSSLRVFLLTLAVVDDLIVIAIIAIAYSGSLDVRWLLGALALIATYALLAKGHFRASRSHLGASKRHVDTAFRALSVVVGLGAWWCTLHSGIHATVAGVVLALLTPAHPEIGQRLEHALAPWSAGLAVPVFALMSAGVAIGSGAFDHRVFWGVFLGLVIGKPLGIAVGAIATSRATGMPWDGGAGATWRDLVGLGFIGGIGFTVALLVSDLAFADERVDEAKAAVLLASTTAAILGAAILALSSRSTTRVADPERASG